MDGLPANPRANIYESPPGQAITIVEEVIKIMVIMILLLVMLILRLI
jgi:competence protein ComGC